MWEECGGLVEGSKMLIQVLLGYEHNHNNYSAVDIIMLAQSRRQTISARNFKHFNFPDLSQASRA
jgi:hypothetical protein